jgi:hypothetical protein
MEMEGALHMLPSCCRVPEVTKGISHKATRQHETIWGYQRQEKHTGKQLRKTVTPL